MFAEGHNDSSYHASGSSHLGNSAITPTTASTSAVSGRLQIIAPASPLSMPLTASGILAEHVGHVTLSMMLVQALAFLLPLIYSFAIHQRPAHTATLPHPAHMYSTRLRRLLPLLRSTSTATALTPQ